MALIYGTMADTYTLWWGLIRHCRVKGGGPGSSLDSNLSSDNTARGSMRQGAQPSSSQPDRESSARASSGKIQVGKASLFAKARLGTGAGGGGERAKTSFIQGSVSNPATNNASSPPSVAGASTATPAPPLSPSNVELHDVNNNNNNNSPPLSPVATPETIAEDGTAAADSGIGGSEIGETAESSEQPNVFTASVREQM